jgi:hypothetical protein
MHIYVNKIIGVVLDSDSQFHFRKTQKLATPFS